MQLAGVVGWLERKQPSALTQGVDACGTRLNARDRESLVILLGNLEAWYFDVDQLVERRHEALAGGVQLKRDFLILVEQAGIQWLCQFKIGDGSGGG